MSAIAKGFGPWTVTPCLLGDYRICGIGNVCCYPHACAAFRDPPTPRRGRIAAIVFMIEAGEYKPDPAAISRRLVAREAF